MAAELTSCCELRERDPGRFALFFPDSDGETLRHNNRTRDRWEPLREASGLESTGITPHGCRHSRIALIAQQHTDGFIHHLQKFASHSTVQQLWTAPTTS